MQSAVEMGGKKLKAVVAEVVGEGKQVGLVKQEGQVSVGWHPVVKVVAPSRDSTELRWFLPGCAKAGISDEQREEIRVRFLSVTGRVSA